MKPTTVRRMIKRVEADGWYLAETKGSHRQFRHPTKKGRVTVSGNLGDEIDRRTHRSILRQAGLE